MKLPERVRIAVDLLKHLRTISDGQPRRVKDLADVLGTSENFLHQVVAKLGAAKFISVIKGPRGGVNASINEVNLLQVYQLFGYMTDEVVGTLPSADVERQLRKVIEDITI